MSLLSLVLNWGPSIDYVHTKGEEGGGGVQAAYTFPVRFSCRKGGEEVQIACKIVYVINGQPFGRYFEFYQHAYPNCSLIGYVVIVLLLVSTIIIHSNIGIKDVMRMNGQNPFN